MSLQPGLRIADKYKLLRRLGAGALGEVWCARNEVVEREVAIKFIQPAWTVDPVAIDRFFADAKASGKIRHPSIVELLDLGRTTAGVPYTVMELLEADKLDDVLQRVESLPTGTALRIVSELARALAAAHEKRLPHLRIEPANVLLHRVQRSPKLVDVVPKLVDFGVARLVQMAPARAKRIDDLLGPIAYLAPEQEYEAGIVDQRTDVWGLGVLLYHCMVGALPFAAKTIEELVVAHKSPCVAPNVIDPSIDASVSNLVMECLTSREKRPTARRLADRLDDLLRRFDDAWGDLGAVLEIPEERISSKLAVLDPPAIEEDGLRPSSGRMVTQPIFGAPPPPSAAPISDDDAQPVSSSEIVEVPPSSDDIMPVSTRDFVQVQQAQSHRPPRPAPSNQPVPLVTRVAPKPGEMGETAADAEVPQILQRLSMDDASQGDALLDELEAALLERVAVQRASQLPEAPKVEAVKPPAPRKIEIPSPKIQIADEDVEEAASAHPASDADGDVTPPPPEGLFGPKAVLKPQPVLLGTGKPRHEDETTSPGKRVSLHTMPPGARGRPPILPLAIGVVVVGLIAFAVASPKKQEPVMPAPAPTSTTTAAASATGTTTATEAFTAMPTASATATATTEPTTTATTTATESPSATTTPTTMITATAKPKPTTTASTKPTVVTTATSKPTATATATTKPKDPFYGVDNSGI